MGIEIVSRPASEEEGSRIVARAQELVDIKAPFRCLPGNPPDHKIIAECADGFKVRAIVAETVYNDWLFIDYCCGEGHYEKRSDARIREILQIARKLYDGENHVS